MEPIAVVMVLALIEYFVFGMLAGRARVEAGIEAPATVGDHGFERHFRVQQNTLEQLVIFLPALWIFGLYVHVLWGAGLGLVFVIGRAVYYRGYIEDPKKRSLGFLISLLAQTVLLLGGLVGAVISWV